MTLSIDEIQKKIEEVERRLQEAEVINEMLANHLQELSFLYEVSRKFSQAGSSREIFKELSKILKNKFQITEYILFRFNEKTRLLEILNTRGFTRIGTKDLFYNINEGLVGRCFAQNKAIYVPHAEKLQKFSYLFAHGKSSGSLYYIPLREENKDPIGVLKFKKTRRDAFENAERKLLFSLSDPLARALLKAEERDQAAKSSLLDERTGFYNKRYFPLAMEREFKRAQRYRHPISLIYIEIKNKATLKKIVKQSDLSQILKNLAKNLAKNIRRSDIAIQYGKESFFFLLPETGFESALQTARKLHQVIYQTLISSSNGESIPTDIIQIGLSSYPHDSIEPDQLVELAKHPRKEFSREVLSGKNSD